MVVSIVVVCCQGNRNRQRRQQSQRGEAQCFGFQLASFLQLPAECIMSRTFAAASSLGSRGWECYTDAPVVAEASCEHFQAKRHSVFGWSRLPRRLCPHPHPRTHCRRGSPRTELAEKYARRRWGVNRSR